MLSTTTLFPLKAYFIKGWKKNVPAKKENANLSCRTFEPSHSQFNNFKEDQLNSLLDSLQESLRQPTRERHEIITGKSLNGLSEIYLRLRNYERSLSYSKAASIILAKTSVKSDYALSLFLLGRSYSELNKQASAVTCFNAALALYEELKNTEYQNLVTLCLGRSYVRQKQYLFGFACYESVLDSLANESFCRASSNLLTVTVSLIMQSCKARYGEQGGITAYHKLTSRYLSDNISQQVTHLLQQLGQTDEPISKNPGFKVQ